MQNIIRSICSIRGINVVLRKCFSNPVRFCKTEVQLLSPSPQFDCKFLHNSNIHYKVIQGSRRTRNTANILGLLVLVQASFQLFGSISFESVPENNRGLAHNWSQTRKDMSQAIVGHSRPLLMHSGMSEGYYHSLIPPRNMPNFVNFIIRK